MSLTQEQISRLKKLTSLNHTNPIDIDGIVAFFDQLKSVSTDKHRETRSGQGTLIPRTDVVTDSHIADALLACSNQKKLAHQIVLSGIMHGE